MIGIILAAAVTINGVTLDCSQWQRNPDGSWRAWSADIDANGAVMHGTNIPDLRRGVLNNGGVDVFEAVDSTCR